jgi:hypothetical protein
MQQTLTRMSETIVDQGDKAYLGLGSISRRGVVPSFGANRFARGFPLRAE